MPLIILVILSFLPLVSLFHPGMFAGHDSQAHIARLVAFYQSLNEGNIIPRWAANLNMGYGHPVLMFLYPLSGYLGSLFHFAGFSYIDSVKLTFSFSYIFSGIFMYLFAKELFGKKVGFLSAVLYLFTPYRFVDLYVRAALGEHLAFTFMPLVLWGFTKLIRTLNTYYLIPASVSLAFLILSHNAISLMFMPFLALYLIILIYLLPHKSKVISLTLVGFALGFSLSAFFWLPALTEGKYTLRDIVTVNEYKLRFPSFLSLFYSPWSFGGSDSLSKEVGSVSWLMVVIGLFYIVKNRQKKDLAFWVIAVCEFTFWVVVFLLNKFSIPVWEKISILQKFQFPWRFLTMTVLLTSILPAVVKKKKHIIVLACLAILPTVTYWQPKGYLKEDDRYFVSVYNGTTDTGESSPIWSIRGMEQRPRTSLEWIEGYGKISAVKRNSTRHEYSVEAQDKARLVDNTVYFPGWNVLVDGKKTGIEFQDPNFRGLITFLLPPGRHEVKVIFQETKLRQAADDLSVVSILVLFGILIAYAIRRSRHL